MSPAFEVSEAIRLKYGNWTREKIASSGDVYLRWFCFVCRYAINGYNNVAYVTDQQVMDHYKRAHPNEATIILLRSGGKR